MTLMIATSNISDGSMSKGVLIDERDDNRLRFLNANDIDPARTIWSRLEYSGDDYCRYVTVDESHMGDGIVRESSLVSDSMFTRSKDVALFLPIADCIAAVLYDPKQQVLGLAHFGRHNLEQRGATRSIEYMTDHFNTDPADIEVWLSPAAGKENYPLHGFNSRSLVDVALEQLKQAGVPKSHIDVNDIDTTKDENYFSHSEFLKGNRALDGRQVVVTRM